MSKGQFRIRYRNGQRIYECDGKEVSEEEFNERWYIQPPNYAKGEIPRVRGDLGDFSQENGGRGRYIPQLAEKPQDPNAYYRTARDAEYEAHKRGHTTERM